MTFRAEALVFGAVDVESAIARNVCNVHVSEVAVTRYATRQGLQTSKNIREVRCKSV